MSILEWIEQIEQDIKQKKEINTSKLVHDEGKKLKSYHKETSCNGKKHCR